MSNSYAAAKKQQRGKTANIRTNNDLIIPQKVRLEMDVERHQKYLKKKKEEIKDHNSSLDVVPEQLEKKKLLGNNVIVKLFKIDLVKEEKSITGDDVVYVMKTEEVPIQTDSGTKVIEVPNPLPYLYAGCIHKLGEGVTESGINVGDFVEVGSEIDLQKCMYYIRKDVTDRQPTLDELQENNHEIFPLYEGYVKIHPSYIESIISKDFY